MILILMGSPASGKGTQAELIGEKYKIPHLSSGKIFREEVKNESTLGLEIKHYLASGSLIPDNLTIQIMDHILNQMNISEGLILDGFPRTLIQATKLEQLLAGKNYFVSFVFNLVVPKEELFKRLSSRGRKDDQEEIFQNRLRLHEQQSKPLLDFYQNKGVLRTINGNQNVHDVFKEIDNIIKG
ncbi:adenylate kinase [Niallia taxi]|uniref:adenylate kinase n=1 Tax=Niallia taxi TaxID=2499688 RepID=UPI002E222161|nr:adenylate kinase [Niallia taxi]MED4041064.1 adenylate kinase [Niallia taxi]